jgi:hypothetical protein
MLVPTVAVAQKAPPRVANKDSVSLPAGTHY